MRGDEKERRETREEKEECIVEHTARGKGAWLGDAVEVSENFDVMLWCIMVFVMNVWIKLHDYSRMDMSGCMNLIVWAGVMLR